MGHPSREEGFVVCSRAGVLTLVYPLGYSIYGRGHTTKYKSKLIVRMKRIRGQMAAVERALEEGTDCAEVLQF